MSGVLNKNARRKALTPLGELLRRASAHDRLRRTREQRQGSRTTTDYRDAYIDAFVDVLQDQFSRPHQALPAVTASDSTYSRREIGAELMQKLSAKRLSHSSALAVSAGDGHRAMVMESFGSWREPAGGRRLLAQALNRIRVAKYNIVHESQLPHVHLAHMYFDLNGDRRGPVPSSRDRHSNRPAAAPGARPLRFESGDANANGPLLAHPAVLRQRCMSRFNAQSWARWNELLEACARQGRRRRDGYRRPGLTGQAQVAGDAFACRSTSMADDNKSVFDALLNDSAWPVETLCVQLDDTARELGWQTALRVFIARAAVTVEATVAHLDPTTVAMINGRKNTLPTSRRASRGDDEVTHHSHRAEVKGSVTNAVGHDAPRGPLKDDDHRVLRSLGGGESTAAAALVRQMLWASLFESMRVHCVTWGRPPVHVMRRLLRLATEDSPAGASSGPPRLLLPMWIDLLRPSSSPDASSAQWEVALRTVHSALASLQKQRTVSSRRGVDARSGGAMGGVYLTPLAWSRVFTMLRDCQAPPCAVHAMLDKITADVESSSRSCAAPGAAPSETEDASVRSNSDLIVSVSQASRHMRYVRIWNEFIRAAYSRHCSSSEQSMTDGWTAALRLLTQNMPAYNVEPTADTYAAAADVCTSHGQWEVALRLVGPILRAREGSLITRTASTYVASFDALRVGKQKEVALALLTSSELSHDFSDVVTTASSDDKSGKIGLMRVEAESEEVRRCNNRLAQVSHVCKRLLTERSVPPAVLVAATTCLLTHEKVAVPSPPPPPPPAAADDVTEFNMLGLM